jgi:DNA-binding response OmpR family regulator
MPRILIVDDDPDMAELLGHMSDILGFDHLYVPTGDEAVDLCRQNLLDAVVLDVMLEDTDGWAVYKRLAPITSAPIVFITAWRTGENRQRADSMLADGFLAKPISHQDFAQQLKKVLGQPARRLTPSMPAPV